MAHWVKINYDRQDYIIDLERVSSFVVAPNGRITFWLPDASIPIILNQQSNLEDYQKVLQHIKNTLHYSSKGEWVYFPYDRADYFVNLERISTFSYSSNHKLTFWLPDSSLPIILTEQSDPETYKKLQVFIGQKTGYSLS